jgi:hypothetical protein
LHVARVRGSPTTRGTTTRPDVVGGDVLAVPHPLQTPTKKDATTMTMAD